MKNLWFFIFISFSFSSIYPIHDKILHSFGKVVNEVQNNRGNNIIENEELNINVKAMLFSALLPGSGEYIIGKEKRAFFFLGMEVLVISTWNRYNNKGIETQSQYKKFADEHWNLKRWFSDYYRWSDPGNEFHYNFINEDLQEYSEIWEDSHHLIFSIDGNVLNSNSNEFQQLYNNNLTDSLMVENFFENHIVEIHKDHHYYENIGKYDHFFAGWEDNDSLYIHQKDIGGEYIAMSPYKKEYRKIWDNSNDYYKVASFALSSLLVNHCASIIDVIILSKLSSNKASKLSATTYFSSSNSFGLGGIKLSLNWD